MSQNITIINYATMYITCVFLLYFFLAATDGKQFRADYTYYPAVEGWFKMHNIPATWQDARLRCHHEGAALASPENELLMDAMRKTLVMAKITCGVFTGVHATFSKGDYYTIEGTPLTKFEKLISWAPNEPDNFENGEDCLIMLPNGTMADAPCTDVLPYLCFKKRTKTVVSGCGTVDFKYTLDPRTGSCYKFHKEPQTWSRAFAACSGEGGHLVIINSETEAQVVKELYAKNPSSTMPGVYQKENAFVGINDWNEHGSWLTIHGQSLEDAGYIKWAPGQPNNQTHGQFCGSVNRNALFDDDHCFSRFPFICEKSPDSLISEDDK